VRDFVRDLRAAPGTPATHERSPFLTDPNVRKPTAKAPTGEPSATSETGDIETQTRTAGPGRSVTPTSPGKLSSGVSARALLAESAKYQFELRAISGATVAAWGYLHY